MLQSPWTVHGWDPVDVIDYVSFVEYQVVYDYSFKRHRIPEFTVSLKDIERGSLSLSHFFLRQII